MNYGVFRNFRPVHCIWNWIMQFKRMSLSVLFPQWKLFSLSCSRDKKTWQYIPFLREKLTQTKYIKLLGKGWLSLDHAQNVAISRKKQTDNFTVNTGEALPIKLITTLFIDGDIRFLSHHNTKKITVVVWHIILRMNQHDFFLGCIVIVLPRGNNNTLFGFGYKIFVSCKFWDNITNQQSQPECCLHN